MLPIDEQTVRDRMWKQYPWHVAGAGSERGTYFAVCPYCDNPIRLQALLAASDASPQAYGMHTGKPQPGFQFDPVRHRYCPYVLKRTARSKTEKRSYDGMAAELIDMAVSEFDRIVLILADDFGFRISERMAEEILRGWFSDEGYLYAGAHLRNLPWMIAYFGATVPLYGRMIGGNQELARSISENVEGAFVKENGQLKRQGAYFDVQMQCHDHKSTMAENRLTETMGMRVKDLTRHDPYDAPLLYEKTITFDPERFEALMNTPDGRAKRDARLLDLAASVREKLQ